MNAPDKTLFAGEVVMWIQIDGPKSETILLGCHGLDSLEENLGSINIVRCRDLSGPNKWKIVDSYKDPEDLIEGSINSNLNCKLADYLETLDCPFRLYILAVCCGRMDRFNNRSRAWVVNNADISTRSLSNLVSKDEQAVVGMEVSFSAIPPLLRYFELAYNASNTAATGDQFLVSLIDDSPQCSSSCGAQTIACGDIISASGADFFQSTDGGVNFVALASATQLTAIRAIAACPNGELVAAGTGPVGIEWSVDGGQTWAAATGAVLPAPASPTTVRGNLLTYYGDYMHYAAGNGNVYRSSDCGQTWELTYAAIHTTSPAADFAIVGSDLCVIFSDGTIIKSSNNGESYGPLNSVTVGGSTVVSAASADRFLYVTLADGSVLCSEGDYTTWNSAGVPGATSPDTIISVFDDYNGIVTKGSNIYQTIDGGTNWALIGTAPSTIQAHQSCNQNHLTVVGNGFAATLQPFRATSSSGAINPTAR